MKLLRSVWHVFYSMQRQSRVSLCLQMLCNRSARRAGERASFLVQLNFKLNASIASSISLVRSISLKQSAQRQKIAFDFVTGSVREA